MTNRHRRILGSSMTAEDVQIALAALDLEGQVRRVARYFDVEPRTVWRWLEHGAPPHIALAFGELLSGRLRLRGVRYFLARVGRSRDDGDRYSKEPPLTAAK
jgi:hypothetical protein